jgi:hypothetical protein
MAASLTDLASAIASFNRFLFAIVLSTKFDLGGTVIYSTVIGIYIFVNAI